MEPLPPIPTPLEQRWREFRIQVLPVVFFLSIVAALVFVWRSYIIPVNIAGEGEAIARRQSPRRYRRRTHRGPSRSPTGGSGKGQTADPALLSGLLASGADGRGR
jgi:hypothetical protein